jgi:hypothetical protein
MGGSGRQGGREGGEERKDLRLLLVRRARASSFVVLVFPFVTRLTISRPVSNSPLRAGRAQQRIF